MKGIGGVFGSYVGAVLTQSFHPKFAFAVSGALGLVETLLGMNLDKSCELTEEKQEIDK